jgi:hypothetical protein
VEGLLHPHHRRQTMGQRLLQHQHQHQHQKQPPLVPLFPIPPASRTSATASETNSSAVDASALMTARADAALNPPALALDLM